MQAFPFFFYSFCCLIAQLLLHYSRPIEIDTENSKSKDIKKGDREIDLQIGDGTDEPEITGNQASR